MEDSKKIFLILETVCGNNELEIIRKFTYYVGISEEIFRKCEENFKQMILRKFFLYFGCNLRIQLCIENFK